MQHTQLEFERPAKPNHVSAYLSYHRRELLALLDGGAHAGADFARRHAKLMDELVSSLFDAALSAMPQPTRVVLGAVGGYGRGLLGWKSDLDLRFVTDGPPESIQPLAEGMLYALWDAGVSVGHQVSTVTDLVEAARDDLPTATSLLDFRRVAGDLALAGQLEMCAFNGVFAERELPDFLRRLDEEVSERYKRFGDSVYLLEPDVKCGAGGLRDLDTALWAARARFRTTGVHDLLRVGLLSSAGMTELANAKDFLWKVRNQLHRHANRRSDRLTFDEQESLAELLGYRARLSRPPANDAEARGEMVEAFMSDYYRHARVVLRVRDQVSASATPLQVRRPARVVELGEGLQSFNGQLTFSELAALEATPVLALRLYCEAVDRGLTVLPVARDQVIRSAATPEFCEALRQSPEAAALFVQLVKDPRMSPFRNGSILTELHDVGLLIAMIPEFLPVVGRVHHDIYHVYTVDVHSIAAVDRLRALARGDLLGEHPLASRLAAELARPKVLYLATLLHDVGKAIGGHDHSGRGAEMARTILARLGFSEPDIEDSCHLIFQHLVMYRVAARRNLEDPATVSEFTKEVHGAEGLRHLFLLTVVDLSTTSPTSMTKWKSHMLDELFVITEQILTGSHESDLARLSTIRAAVIRCWAAAPDIAFLTDYLRSMPVGYLLSNGPEEIACHARIALRGTQTSVSAAMVPSRRAEITELCVVTGERYADPLCVVTSDRPGTLASISAVITANGFDVHAAQIHSRRASDGTVQAVDLFWITDRRHDEDEFEVALKNVERDLQSVISGAIAPEDLLKRRGSGRQSDRPAPAVTTEVIVDNGASTSQTLVEVTTRDRPGLLFMLSRAFHALGLTIAVAKINTEGTRVIDVFYVTELDERKVEEPARIAEVRRTLLGVLHGTARA